MSSDSAMPWKADRDFDGPERPGTDLMAWESEVSFGFDDDIRGYRRVPLPTPDYSDSYADSDLPLQIPLKAKPGPALESYDYYSDPA
jgi:hypothetical protein